MLSVEISDRFSHDWVRIIGWGAAGDRSEVSCHHFLSVWAANFDTDLIIWLRLLHCWLSCPAGLPTGLSVLLFGACHHAASVCLRDGETALTWASCVFANRVEFCRRIYLIWSSLLTYLINYWVVIFWFLDNVVFPFVCISAASSCGHWDHAVVYVLLIL